MRRTGCFGKRLTAVLALLCSLFFFAGNGAALEVQPGQLMLSAAEETVPGKIFEAQLRFTPDESQILDSYRVEISYDPQVLEFASSKTLSDHFNGKFEMVQKGSLLSVIYLAEYDDVMREPVDMATLRFRTLDDSFSGATALTLKNMLTGEEESLPLEFTAGTLASSGAKATASKASSSKASSSKAGSSKASSSKSGSNSSKSSGKEGASSSILVVGGSHRDSDVKSNLPMALQTVILAALVIILAAIVAVVVKNRKKPQDSDKKDPPNKEKNL